MGKFILNGNEYGGGGNMTEELSELYYGSIAEREALANAITNKKVSTNASDSLMQMATNVNNIIQINTEDATATAVDINEGKTAYVNGVKIIGTDTNSYSVIHKNVCVNTSAVQTLSTGIVTIEKDGWIYAEYSVNSGSITSSLFTVNDTNKNFKTKIPVKAGDKVECTIKVNYGIFGNGYFVISHLFLVYPTL